MMEATGEDAKLTATMKTCTACQGTDETVAHVADEDAGFAGLLCSGCQVECGWCGDRIAGEVYTDSGGDKFHPACKDEVADLRRFDGGFGGPNW